VGAHPLHTRSPLRAATPHPNCELPELELELPRATGTDTASGTVRSSPMSQRATSPSVTPSTHAYSGDENCTAAFHSPMKRSTAPSQPLRPGRRDATGNLYFKSAPGREHCWQERDRQKPSRELTISSALVASIHQRAVQHILALRGSVVVAALVTAGGSCRMTS